jgi:hypothetical protein
VTGSIVLRVVAYTVAVAIVGAASIGKRAAGAVRAVTANVPGGAADGSVHASLGWMPVALAASCPNTRWKRSW